MKKSKSYVLDELLRTVDESGSTRLYTRLARVVLRDARGSLASEVSFGTTFGVFFALLLLVHEGIVSSKEATEKLEEFRNAS